jgi:hypothetical protein
VGVKNFLKKYFLGVVYRPLAERAAVMYNLDTMKTHKLKTRAHRVLFAKDSPFKPKQEPLQNKYRRQPKHKNLWYNLVSST